MKCQGYQGLHNMAMLNFVYVHSGTDTGECKWSAPVENFQGAPFNKSKSAPLKIDSCLHPCVHCIRLFIPLRLI